MSRFGTQSERKLVEECTKSQNLSQIQTEEILLAIANVDYVIETFFYVIPIILMPFAIVLNLFFIVLAKSRFRRATSRNYYLFLVNRSASDCISGVVYFIIPVAAVSELESSKVQNIHGFFVEVNFCLICFTYVGLAIITAIAILKPLFYRTKITERPILYSFAAFWVLSIAYATMTTSLTGNMFFVSQSDHCPTETCQMALASLSCALVLLCYIGAPFAYIGAAVVMHRRRHLLRAVGLQMWKLGVNICMFVVLCLPTVLMYVVVLMNMKRYIEEQINDKECFIVIDAGTTEFRYKMWMSAGVSFAVWMVRMVLDPLVNILMDRSLAHPDETFGGTLSPRGSRIATVS